VTLLVGGWRDTFVEGGPEMTPLGRTIEKPGQGVAGWAEFPAGRYPACSKHGAMNRVATVQLWRCPACNIGVELTTARPA
jgi:hypothetical protein